MKDARSSGLHWTRVSVYVGATLFLIALLGSAIAMPGLRILHSFQALIYVAVIVLARRNSPWGYGAGFAIAIVWNGMEFMAHVMQVDAVALWSSLRTGHLPQLVPMSVMLGGAAHFILIVAALFALRRYNADARKWWKFTGGGVLSVAYFAVMVVIFHPR